jgi:hypothetical protein
MFKFTEASDMLAMFCRPCPSLHSKVLYSHKSLEIVSCYIYLHNTRKEERKQKVVEHKTILLVFWTKDCRFLLHT